MSPRAVCVRLLALVLFLLAWEFSSLCLLVGKAGAGGWFLECDRFNVSGPVWTPLEVIGRFIGGTSSGLTAERESDEELTSEKLLWRLFPSHSVCC